VALALGDSGAAFTWLEESCRRRAPILAYIAADPVLAPFREDSRCRALLQNHA
jgi:hypothetical protein